MSDREPIHVHDSDGGILTFDFCPRAAAWCRGDFRLKYDGYDWQALLIEYGTGVNTPHAEAYSATFEDPQNAFDSLRRQLRRYAQAAGAIK